MPVFLKNAFENDSALLKPLSSEIALILYFLKVASFFIFSIQ